MPRRIAPLSDVQVKNAKPREKDCRLFDGYGLTLVITRTGGKLWRMKYSYAGRAKQLSFGAYPAVTLADARKLRADAEKLLGTGVDPGTLKKAQKLSKNSESTNSFEVQARAWHEANIPRWADSHAATTLARLEKNVFPWLGSKPVDEIALPDIRSVLHRIEERAAESARRMFVCLNMIFRYCVAVEKIARNPLEGLKPRDLLTTTPVETHLPAITDPKELAALLRAIDEFKGTHVVKCALRLAPLLFQRPGDLRRMEWTEVDFERAEWNIPVEKMKLCKVQKAKRKGEFHCVPLSAQGNTILRQIQPLTGDGRYAFPGQRSSLRCMRETTP